MVDARLLVVAFGVGSMFASSRLGGINTARNEKPFVVKRNASLFQTQNESLYCVRFSLNRMSRIAAVGQNYIIWFLLERRAKSLLS